MSCNSAMQNGKYIALGEYFLVILYLAAVAVLATVVLDTLGSLKFSTPYF